MLMLLWLVLLETVLHPHCLVGNSNHMAASCMLVHLNVYRYGAYTSPNSFNGRFWHVCVDISRILSSPFPFPHWNKELLVSSFSPSGAYDTCTHTNNFTISYFCIMTFNLFSVYVSLQSMLEWCNNSFRTLV